jgi:hypothetical protein
METIEVECSFHAESDIGRDESGLGALTESDTGFVQHDQHNLPATLWYFVASYFRNFQKIDM